MDLTTFCADPQLVELLELAKSSNDIFELLYPGENQHSDILKWCFNAKEGHGQDDSVLKDFLLAVFSAATEDEPGDKIFGRGLSRDFVRVWTPARIMTSSFATAIGFREYVLPKGKKGEDTGRLDLLVIDLSNNIMIVIENKVGTRFRSGQLESYLEGVQKALLSRPVFKNFQVVFVAMDMHCELDEVPSPKDNFDARWVRLNYEWLIPAAIRAEVAVKRGNQNAALLLSYCRAHTSWESKEAGSVTRLARDIAIRFPTVISEIKRVSQDMQYPETWTPKLVQPDGTDGQLLRLYMQNRYAYDNWLIDLPPLQLLHAQLAQHFPDLDKEDVTEYGRVVTSYQLPLNISLPRIDGRWPLYLHIRHTDPANTGQPRFRVQLVWRPHCVPKEDQKRICDELAAQFPEVTATENRKIALKLRKEFHNGFDDAEKAVRTTIAKVQQAFKAVS
jgi:hypothetical protein